MEIGKTEYEGGLDILSSGLDIVLGALGAVGPVSGVNAVRKLIEQKRTDKTIKNIKAFLKEASKATQEQKENFKKLMGDNYQEFQDNLLNAIDQLDREEKAEILGKLQKALFEGKLNDVEFLKFAKVLDLIYIHTLKFFFSKDSSSFSEEARYGTEQYYQELIGLGLMYSEYVMKESMRPGLSSKPKDDIIQKYKITPIGNLLIDILKYNVRHAGYEERTRGTRQAASQYPKDVTEEMKQRKTKDQT